MKLLASKIATSMFKNSGKTEEVLIFYFIPAPEKKSKQIYKKGGNIAKRKIFEKAECWDAEINNYRGVTPFGLQLW